MPDEYISREAAMKAANEWVSEACMAPVMRVSRLFDKLAKVPAADVAEVVHCKDCKYSTLPSELTQRYGKPGTLTCHNKYSPCNRRNVSENDFCSYGEAE